MSHNFEIVLVVKDSFGNPTNRRKSLSSDSADAIYEFYWSNQGKPKRKRRKTKAQSSELPKGEQATKLLKDAAKYAEQKQVKKNT